jgi:hypothetical protein
MVLEPDQVAFLGCYVLAACCVGHWLLHAEPLRVAVRRSLGPLACCGLVALALAGLPLFITQQFLEASNRPEVALAEAVRGSLHPASLLTLVVADLFGSINPAVDYWGPYSEWWDKSELTLSHNMCQVYLGTLPILLLATVGIVRGALWAREVRVLALAAAVLLLYALGGYTPLFGLSFSYLPGVSFFRRPVDATFLVGAVLAIVSGYLVHLWASAALPSVSRRMRLLEAALLVAALIAALAVAAGAGKLALAWRPLSTALVWLLLAALLLAVPRLWLRRNSAFVLLAPAMLLAGDLALNNGPNDSTALPPSRFEVLRPDCRNDTIRFLKARLRRDVGTAWRDRVELVGLGFEWQNAALVHGFEGTLGYNPFRLGDISDATGARDYIAGPDQKQFSPLFPSYASIMADLLGLRFIVVSVPIEQVDARLRPHDLRLVARTDDAYVYENPRALPRVLFVADWQQADFEAMVGSGLWPAFDPRRTVLLDAPPAAADPIMALARAPSATTSVRIRSYANTEVVIEVEAAEAGFVVLNDVWHPWWTATVDGVGAPILRANVLFRAVQVPAGRHVLTFAFEPISIAIADAGDRLFAPREP